jgi:hypothetical protein
MYLPQQWQTILYDEHIHHIQSQAREKHVGQLHREEEQRTGSTRKQNLPGPHHRLAAMGQLLRPPHPAERT